MTNNNLTNKRLTPQQLQDTYDVAVMAERAQMQGADMADFDLLCKLDEFGGIAHVIRGLIDTVRAERAELQQRRKADELSLQTAPALYSLSKTGEVRCSNSPVIPDGYCIMPVTLTAENGAKRALSGEFSIPRAVTCPECGGDGCSDCDGRGDWNEDQLIDWPTIKLIYQKVVEVCAIPATQKQDKSA